MALTHSELRADLSPMAQAKIGLTAYRIALEAIRQDRLGNGIGVSEEEAESMKSDFKLASGGGVVFTVRDLLMRHSYRELLKKYEVPMTREEMIQAVSRLC